ncbi:MAG: thiamine diphosphokinase, partial [Anaerolineales bacterium]
MRAVIFAAGEIPDREAARRGLRPEDWIVAADGGASHCLALGLTPALLIGDLDSVDPAQAAAWRRAGVEVIAHPPDKDKTDLELALLLAVERGAAEILVLGAMGGRWDHSLANVLLAAHPALRGVPLTVSDGMQQVRLLESEARLQGSPGDIVSLIPIGGDADGITTHG